MRSREFWQQLDVNYLNSLIDKYSKQIPRYTSYPTAVEFTADIKPQDWASVVRAEFSGSSMANGQAPLGLYVHVPFCHSLCYFCACNKKIAKDDSGVEPYLNAVEKELLWYKKILPANLSLDHLHWGGGTPNFISVDATRRLFDLNCEPFSGFAANADISVEVDPRSVSEELLRTYSDLGFTRISLGVQDFSIDVQQAINRVQTFEQTSKVCSDSRDLGISSVNLDLIYGLPLQTADSFRGTVDKVLEIRPDRIALYGYAHVTWKKKVQKSLQRHALPTPRERVEIFVEAVRALLDAGYVYIGMDHFALPEDTLSRALDEGRLNRNFMGYSTHKNLRLIGVGMSSVSTLPEMLVQNTHDFENYVSTAGSAGSAICRGVRRDWDDQIRAEVIEQILCSGEIDFSKMQERWEFDFSTYFASDIESLSPFQAEGLVEISSAKLSVTPLGKLFVRNIASAFDAYLNHHAQSEIKVFSQSL